VASLVDHAATGVHHGTANLHGPSCGVPNSSTHDLADALGCNERDAGTEDCEARIKKLHQSTPSVVGQLRARLRRASLAVQRRSRNTSF
jgi:hypothetical protein